MSRMSQLPHQALLIPELLLEILDHLNSAHAVINAGLTCKALSEPALDILWSKLPSIVALIQVIPSIRDEKLYFWVRPIQCFIKEY